jgi:hypothetical protein
MLMGSMAPAFAQLPAGGLALPPYYNTFQPPPVGGIYVDPVFGSTVKRISNALGTPDAAGGGNLTWITDEYSTMSPFNSDNSKILLVHQSYFALYDGTGFYMRDLPLEINSSSEPRWSRKDNRTIYYIRGNQFKTYDIFSGAMNIVHTFSEYSAISGMGESDISFDGDHFVFAGDRRYVFVYRIGADTKSPAFDTGGRSFDSLYITPNNNVTITWNQSGAVRYTGIELFDANMNFQRQVARAGGHMDVTLDTDGNEVLVWTNSNDPQPICNNAIVKIRLFDGQQTCLASFDWSLAVHISAPDNSGFVYVETYAPSNPTPSSGWVAYTNELLQIKLDGSQVLRLAHHRSRPFQTNTYNWQPRMSTSRDGSRVVYNSDYDLQAINGYAGEYSDVYLIVVGSPSTSTAPPAPQPDATPTPAPTTTTTTTTTVVRYEENDPAVQLTGTWFPNNGASNSGGSAILATDQGSQAKVTFTGTGVQWIGFRDAWSGIAQVYVDGALKGTIDTYSANTQAQAVLYSLSGLSNTGHTLTLVVTGTRNANSGGAWVWVDAFDVSIPSTTTTTTPYPAASTTPSTPIRIEQDSPAVVYTGGVWSTNTTAPSSGASAVLSTDANARATVTFTGTAVTWIGYRDQWSGNARVYVDGVLKATIDTYASPSQAQATLYMATALTRGRRLGAQPAPLQAALYTATGLASGVHSLTIEVAGTHDAVSHGSWVWVDAFDITP